MKYEIDFSVKMQGDRVALLISLILQFFIAPKLSPVNGLITEDREKHLNRGGADKTAVHKTERAEE